MKYLINLTKLVETKPSVLQPEKFTLIFDRWTTTHYLAVFESFPDTNGAGYLTRLSTLSTIEYESRLYTDEHIAFMSTILQVITIFCNNVKCHIRDNCNMDKALSNRNCFPFIRWAKNCYNIAIKKF